MSEQSPAVSQAPKLSEKSSLGHLNLSIPPDNIRMESPQRRSCIANTANDPVALMLGNIPSPTESSPPTNVDSSTDTLSQQSSSFFTAPRAAMLMEKRNSTMSIASVAAAVSGAVSSLHGGITAAVSGGYSNDWRFGLFQEWWNVAGNDYNYDMSGQKSQVVKPSPTTTGTTLRMPDAAATSLFDTLPRAHEAAARQKNIIDPMPTDGVENPPRSVSTNILNKAFSATAIAMKENKDVESTSMYPFLEALCCPCVVYAQNRVLFERNGGNSVITTMPRAQKPPSTSVTGGKTPESREISILALEFSALMPFCMCAIPHFAFRRNVRERYSLVDEGQDGKCGEMLISCCCLPCALVQERREILYWQRVVEGAKKRRSVVQFFDFDPEEEE